MEHSPKANGEWSFLIKRGMVFLSVSQYSSVLEKNGLRVVFASHFDRPTLLKDDNGIGNWIQMFGQTYLQDIGGNALDTVLSDVEEQIRPTIF